VQTPGGDWYLAHLTGRPDRPLGRCRLGRETALQAVTWPAGAFPRLAHGGTLPAETVAIDLPAQPWPSVPDGTLFPGPTLPPHFNTLRDPVDPAWCRVGNGLTLIGRDGPTCLHRQSRIARRIQHVELEAETELRFAPDDFQALAGLSAFYDCALWWMLAVTHDEERGRGVQLFWNDAGDGGWTTVGEGLDAGHLSDERMDDQRWNFTGGWVSLSCHDLSGRGAPATFTRFDYRPLGAAPATKMRRNHNTTGTFN
jgi:xylan 1,4-beta-xylosidase